MSEYDFYLRGNPNAVRLQLIEITHPAFSKVYRYVRNNSNGVTVTLPGGTSATFEYYPVTIKKGRTSDDLDQSFTIGVGDLGEEIPADINRVITSSQHSSVKPTFNYYEYSSANLNTPIHVVKGMEVTDYNPQKQGAVFTCKTRNLNNKTTGLIYNLDDHPTLRGFV